jgi:hypothetical protein
LSVVSARDTWGGNSYPPALDLDPTCEAVCPRLAFVDDVLVVTWRERCSPEVRDQRVAVNH